MTILYPNINVKGLLLFKENNFQFGSQNKTQINVAYMREHRGKVIQRG